MALTELQLPTKSEFYANLQSYFTNWDTMIRKGESLSEFLNKAGAADLDAMSIPAGQIRTDLVEARTVIDELVAFFNGTAAI